VLLASEALSIARGSVIHLSGHRLDTPCPGGSSLVSFPALSPDGVANRERWRAVP
jgi:hypothetical protein